MTTIYFMNTISGDVQDRSEWLDDFKNQDDVKSVTEYFEGLIEVKKSENGEWVEA